MTAHAAAWIWAAGLLGWFAVRLPYHRRARRIEVVAHRRSAGDQLALVIATCGLAIIPAIYVATGAPRGATFPFHPWMGWCGAALQGSFLLLFYATHRQLGRQWSPTLEIRTEHKL